MLISKNFLTREASYKPSYLISWSQSGPSGTTLAPVGRQNSNKAGGIAIPTLPVKPDPADPPKRYPAGLFCLPFQLSL